MENQNDCWEPFPETLDLRKRLFEQYKETFQEDPTYGFEEEIEDLLIRIKIKLISMSEWDFVQSNLKNLTKKYFNKDTIKKLKNEESSQCKKGGCKMASKEDRTL